MVGCGKSDYDYDYNVYITGFLPICQNQIQGLSRTIRRYIRSKLKQTGTFISISRQSGPSNPVWSRRFRKSNASTFKDLLTQIQGLSRTMSVLKDFPGLKIWKKNSRTSRTRKSPVYNRELNKEVGCGMGLGLGRGLCSSTGKVFKNAGFDAFSCEKLLVQQKL